MNTLSHGYLGMLLLSLLLCPFLLGLIRRTKAVFAGRCGEPLLQLYYDLWKLLRKNSLYSVTTTEILLRAPIVTVVSSMAALLFLPQAGFAVPEKLSFCFDFIFFIYLFAIGRFMTVLAALDTGSAFCGMGASREVQFSALTEPAFVISLLVLALQSEALSLSEIFTNHTAMNIATTHGTTLLLVSIALFLVMLCESCRVPFDDPNTHLELTMIHEAMILDYSASELALIHYGAALKLWIFSSLLVLTLVPFHFAPLVNVLIYVLGIFVVAVAVGVVESVMARFRLVKIPQMLLSALGFALLSLTLFLLFPGDL